MEKEFNSIEIKNTENENNNNFGNLNTNEEFKSSLEEKKGELEKSKEDKKKEIISGTKKEAQKLKQEVSLNNNQNETFGGIELSKNDFLNFTAMIVAEAKGEGINGMNAVGYAILNRVKLWKKNMNSILFEKGQFSPVSDGRLNKMKGKLSDSDKEIAKNILNGKSKNSIGNATFFQALSAEKGSWQSKAKNLTNPIKIGNHIFRTERRFLRQNGPRQFIV